LILFLARSGCDKNEPPAFGVDGGSDSGAEVERQKGEAERLKAANDVAQRKAEEAERALKEATRKETPFSEGQFAATAGTGTYHPGEFGAHRGEEVYWSCCGSLNRGDPGCC
jgi:hypothetical protein